MLFNTPNNGMTELFSTIDQMPFNIAIERAEKASAIEYFLNQLLDDDYSYSGAYHQELLDLVEPSTQDNLKDLDEEEQISRLFRTWDAFKYFMQNTQNIDRELQALARNSLANFNKKYALLKSVDSLSDAAMTKKMMIAAVRSQCDATDIVDPDILSLYETLNHHMLDLAVKWNTLKDFLLSAESKKYPLYKKALESLLYFQSGSRLNPLFQTIEQLFKQIKERIVENIIRCIAFHLERSNFLTDLESQLVCARLCDGSLSLEDRWEYLQIYISVPTNSNKKLYTIINNTIESFARNRHFLSRLFNPIHHDLIFGSKTISNLEYSQRLVEFETLMVWLMSNEDEAEHFVKEVVNMYEKRKSFFQSSESQILHETLKDKEISLKDKLECISDFMFNQDKEGRLDHNGKKLCRTILSVMEKKMHQVKSLTINLV